jgi:outer membrane protein TolC
MSIVDSTSKFRRPGLLSLILVFLVGSLHAQTPMSLRECIDYGLKNHPTIAVSRNAIENARQAAREAIAGYLPQVNANVNATNNLKLQTNIIPAGALGPGTPEQRITFGQKFTTAVAADASQPIYNASLLTAIKANKPNTELAKLTLEQSRQNVIYNVATAYYQVIINQRQLQLLRGNQERIERLLKVSKLQSEMGVAKKADTKQVQVQLNNVNAQISVADNNVQLSYNTLKNAMGIFQDGVEVSLVDTARWLNEVPMQASNENFRFNNTIDFQLQDKQIQLYDIQAKSIRANNYPVLEVFGQYGLNGFGNNFSDAAGRYFDYGAVGVRLRVSLFDGFRRSAQYRQALIERDNARLNQTVNQASQNLNFLNAGSRVNRAKTTLGVNRDNVDLASEVYENTSLQYRQGVGTLSDMLNAESSYNDAQNNYIQSLVDYYLARLDVARANTSLEEYLNGL